MLMLTTTTTTTKQLSRGGENDDDDDGNGDCNANTAAAITAVEVMIYCPSFLMEIQKK